MAKTEAKLLTIPEVATQLNMTPDGVYKLVQRGKIPAERLSERKTRITSEALEKYIARQQKAVGAFLDRLPATGTPEELASQFQADTGLTPTAFLAAWKSGGIKDTHENMQTLARAASIASMEPALATT